MVQSPERNDALQAPPGCRSELATGTGVEEAARMRDGETRPAGGQRSSWTLLVGVSAVIVLAVALTIGVWWAASSERRVTSYTVRGSLDAIALDLGDADAEIVGGRDEPVVEVRRTDRFAFDQPAAGGREVSDGVLRLRSRCAPAILSSCSATYRLIVPNNVPVTVRTGSGDVQLAGFRGSARIETKTGDVAAVVPPGRYRIDADSDDGERTVRGLLSVDDAPFQILALSGAGDVQVEA